MEKILFQGGRDDTLLNILRSEFCETLSEKLIKRRWGEVCNEDHVRIEWVLVFELWWKFETQSFFFFAQKAEFVNQTHKSR